MGWKRGQWGKVLATVLWVQAVGCSSDEPAPKGPPDAEEAPSALPTPPQAQVPVPPSAPEGPAPACEGLLPEQLGPSRSIAVKALAPYADCGGGTSDGAGFLALMNSGSSGAAAWDVVSGEGVATGKWIGGGQGSADPMPQAQGFLIYRSADHGGLLYAFSSVGARLNYQQLTNAYAYEDYPSVAADPQGGMLSAVWKTRPGNLQVLTYQFFDAVGAPLGAPTELGTLPLDEKREVVAGVDTQGHALLLWPEPGGRTWAGQWLSRQGGPLTQPFKFPAFAVSTSYWRLSPLAGGGLALQRDGQWVARFPSGEAGVQPAPAWLARHPGTRLVLIRNQQANALVLVPKMSGVRCQESLLVFASDGTACGELRFPPDGNTCSLRRLGVGRDGTVIQQLDLGVQATPQCSWRWWPGLLR